MNFLLDGYNKLDKAQQENLGDVSDKLNKPGCVLATIESMYITNAEGWSKVDINFSTPNGTVNISEFNSVPQDDTPEKIAKAEAANTRLQNSIARMLKAAGLKDMATAASGSTEGVDGKGRPTVIFPKVAGKKLYITTYTEIQSDKDGVKAYANQVIDTFKYLDKSGLNGMKINSIEAFDADAKERLEIYFKDTENPACIAKLSQITEQREGKAAKSAAPTEQVAAAGTTNGMPTAEATTTVIDDSDI